MSLDTIILIDRSKEKKSILMEKLKEKVNFSYIKLEALMQTIKEVSDAQGYNFERKKYIAFLDKFIKNISKNSEMNLIDIDNLSVKNANELVQKYDNILVIYLEKIENEQNAVSIDINNKEEVEKLIEEIEKRKKK